MTSKEFIKEIHDYLSFLEEGGGPAMDKQEVHTWLSNLLDEYAKSCSDPVVESVIDKYADRSQEGIKKYGTTLEKNSGSNRYWLTHLQEELMDATLYIERLKQFNYENK
tara:strand:- start:29 stop:355 length:327 start_codon:yes stop_codon:yes gene_type:complete